MEQGNLNDRESATALAEALGNLPLALEQAKAYAAQCELSLTQYLNLFRARQQEVAARVTGSEEYPLALATTFEIALQRIEVRWPAAADLLTVCAFLAPDEVPLEIFKEAKELLPHTLANAAADPETLNRLAATLQEYSLARVRGSSFLSLHRFVQAAARDRLSEDGGKKWTETAVRLMNAAFSFEDSDSHAWQASVRLVQHAMTAAERARELKVAESSTAELFERVALRAMKRAELTKPKSAVGKSVIFLSYVKEDRQEVLEVYRKLKGRGYSPWIDVQDILPGEKWEVAIKNASKAATIVLLFLSKNSVEKRGYIQKEFRNFLARAEQMLDEDIYLIPVKLEQCDLPDILEEYQSIEMFIQDAWSRLEGAIQESIKRRQSPGGNH
jgi:hypothetical protein